MSATCDVVVLLSGTGSNLQALIDSTRTGDSPVRIAAVISNRADAYGLQRASDAGIATRSLDHKAFEGREAFDAALIELIDSLTRCAHAQRVAEPAPRAEPRVQCHHHLDRRGVVDLGAHEQPCRH